MNSMKSSFMRWTLLSLFIAFRLSRGCKHGRMLSMISIISTIGIALGVAVLITGFSAMNGFERELKNRILARVPHGEIEAVNQPLQNWKAIVQRVEKVPGILAAAPYIHFTGLIDNGIQLRVVHLKGVSHKQENKLNTLPQCIQEDSWVHFTAGNQQIILGQGIAEALGITRGTYVTMIISNTYHDLKLLYPKRIRLHVTGILECHGALDHDLAVIPIEDAQQYLDLGTGVTGIAIKVKEVFSAHKLVHDAGKISKSYVFIRSWMNTYGYIYHDIQMIRSIMYLAIMLVIGVACFNIVATLVMVVKEKSRNIAILRTLGAKDTLIRTIFIWYGLLTGLVGALFGVVIGVAISLQLTAIIKVVEKLIGYSFLPSNIYFIDFLPSEVHVLDVIIVLTTAILFSLLASWYPARRATHIDPARILSGE